MRKLIVANAGCLAGAVLFAVLFPASPFWFKVGVFLLPILSANIFLIQPKTSRRVSRRSGLPLAVGVGLILWFTISRYNQKKWISLLANGQSAFERGDYSRAQRRLEAALQSAQQEGQTKAVCKIQNYLSNVHIDQGNYSAAQQAASKGLVSCVGSDDPHDLIAAYGNLGVAYEYEGNHAEADAAFRKGLDFAGRALKATDPQLATIYNDYGTLKQSDRNYEDAERYLRQAFAIWEGDPRFEGNVASCASNLGQVLFLEGRLQEAEGLYKKSLAIGEKTYGPNSPELSPVLNNMGMLYERKGDLKQAGTFFQRAISNMEKSQSTDQARLQAIRDNYQEFLKKTRQKE